jgi:hypothetical protein
MPRSERSRASLVYAPRYVIGYHGCSKSTAARILAGEPFVPSANEWDWLGEGVYFWEYAPARAGEWAQQRFGPQAAVLEAKIKLGRCLNLLDTKYLAGIQRAYHLTVKELTDLDLPVPENRPDGRRYLDQRVINLFCRLHGEETGRPYQTIRACFPEGGPVWPGSGILTKTHVQVAVRDVACIDRVRPVYSW